MGSLGERTEGIELLRGLLDRLCAPDLTLAEAKLLRGRLSDLMEQGDRAGEPGPDNPSPPLTFTSSRRVERRYEARRIGAKLGAVG